MALKCYSPQAQCEHLSAMQALPFDDLGLPSDPLPLDPLTQLLHCWPFQRYHLCQHGLH